MTESGLLRGFWLELNMFNEPKQSKPDLREVIETMDSTLKGFNGFTSYSDPVYYDQPKKESKDGN